MNPLDLLTVELEFFEAKQAEANRMILESAERLAGLESFSATVAAKQEELAALRTLNNELRAKLNRLRVERLAPDRITWVEQAQEFPEGSRVRWLAAAGALSMLGLGLVVCGGFTLRRRT